MLKIKMFLTMTCNLQCTYCYEKNHIQNTSDTNLNYNLDDLYQLIKNRLISIDNNEVSIGFYGGEPLLRFNEIKNIIDHFNLINDEIKINYEVTTNGTLITNEISKYFKTNKVKIAVSLDGDEESTVNRIYKNKKPAFLDVLNGIKTLQKELNEIIINIVINSENFYKLIKNLEFLIGLSINNFSIAIDFFDEKWLNITDEALLNFYSELKYFCLLNENIYVGIFEKKVFPLTQCTLEETLSITPDGSVYPCIYFPTSNGKDLKLGHITKSLDWTLLNSISKEVICENKTCASYSSNCSIGCYGLNITCSGELYTPSPILCKHYRCSIQAISNYKLLKLRNERKRKISI